jgi:hypothetical protein
VDTLIVNRRIDKASRPVPEILKLGSLKEIGDELGLADSGKNRNDIRRALHQNAGAKACRLKVECLLSAIHAKHIQKSMVNVVIISRAATA